MYRFRPCESVRPRQPVSARSVLESQREVELAPCKRSHTIVGKWEVVADWGDWEVHSRLHLALELQNERGSAWADHCLERRVLPIAIPGDGSPPKRSKPAALDFFAGSGLAAEALRSCFKIVWANDICEKKAATYRANHSARVLNVENISAIRGSDLPNAELSWASFPCQDLSLAGDLKGIDSPRSGLVWQWLRVMDEMEQRPRVVVAENVVGLVSANHGKHYLALHNALIARGFRVGALVLDAERWVPQSRSRVFVVGVTSSTLPSSLISEEPTWCHTAALKNISTRVKEFVWWKLPEPRASRPRLSDIIDYGVATHSEQESQRNLQLIPAHHRARMESMANGVPMVFPGYKRTRGGQQVLEVRFDDVAGCLRTPQGGSSRQYVVIFKNGRFSTRLLTVQEAARLMGVRASYRILGTYNDGYKAMGDGVAVPTVRHLARHLLLPLART